MLPPDQLAIIKATVPVVRTHGETVTKVFYHNILRDFPDLNGLFSQSNQATGHQARALANAVLAYAEYIETPSTLAPALKHINNKHASMFIQPFQYKVVGQYLFDAFIEVLGPDTFTPEIHTAWLAAYNELADTMIAAEKALYASYTTTLTSPWTDWRPFTIVSKHQESNEITTFTFSPSDTEPLPTYLPGQYISLQLPIPSLGYTQVRQYSLTSNPLDLSSETGKNTYSISVKREAGVSLNNVTHPGIVSNVLHTLPEGATVHLSRPMGEFVLDDSAAATTTPTSTSATSSPTSTTPSSSSSETPLILISAGVGATPLISMLKYTVTARPTRRITWIQGAHSLSHRAFSSTVSDIAARNENVRVIRFLTRVGAGAGANGANGASTKEAVMGRDYEVAGRVDLAKCDGTKDLYLSDETARYFVCGPEGFMDGIKGWLVGKGVDGGRVAVEKFGTG